MQTRQKLFLCFLLLCACINSVHLFTADYNTPIDFRNVYLGAKLWLKDQNPYHDATLKREWYSICEAEGIVKDHPPGLPANSLVYPPHALLIYTPFAFLSWKTAVWVNTAVILFSFCILLWLWMQLSLIPVPVVHILLIVAAFKGTAHAFIVGQPSFLANALALGGVFLCANRKHQWLPAVLLALASFKPTVLLPYLFFLAYKKQWKTIFLAGGGTLLLLTVSLLLYSCPIELMESGRANIRDLKQFIFDNGSMYMLKNITEAGVLPEYFADHSGSFRAILYLVVVIATGIYLVKRTNVKPLSETYVLSLCLLLSLLVTHHLYYDCLFLVPVVFIIPYLSFKARLWLFICSLPLFIPVNGILDRMHLPSWMDVLYFLIPVSLICITCLLLANPVYANEDPVPIRCSHIE